MIAQRVVFLLFLPLLPIAFLIDVIIGDLITGVRVTFMVKMKAHIAFWKLVWNHPINDFKEEK